MTDDVSFQTVRLARGKHCSPRDGACVMELASMLAGEPFSDRPDSVCRVIAAVLRAYNDAVDDARRQDLYGCAAAVLDTRAPDRVERARIERCLSAMEELRDSGETSWWWRVSRASPRGLAALREQAREPASSSPFGFFVGEAFKAAGQPGHRRLLSLIEELVGLPGGVVAAPPSAPSGQPTSVGA